MFRVVIGKFPEKRQKTTNGDVQRTFGGGYNL